MNILEWLRTYGHPGLNTALLILVSLFFANRINSEIADRLASDREFRKKLEAIQRDEADDIAARG